MVIRKKYLFEKMHQMLRSIFWQWNSLEHIIETLNSGNKILALYPMLCKNNYKISNKHLTYSYKSTISSKLTYDCPMSVHASEKHVKKFRVALGAPKWDLTSMAQMDKGFLTTPRLKQYMATESFVLRKSYPQKRIN